MEERKKEKTGPSPAPAPKTPESKPGAVPEIGYGDWEVNGRCVDF